MNAPIRLTSYRTGHRAPILVVREETSTPQERPVNEEPLTEARSEVEPETVADWGVVHRRITELGVERARHERELCRWLLAAERLDVPARAGHASLAEYAERVVGLKGRQTEERLRVGHALAGLPLLDGALARGELYWSAVRELTRVVIPRTEEAWLNWARGKRSRQIEKAVASRRSGDSPADRPDPTRIKHRLSFAVRAETMALFRDLQAAIRTEILSADGVEAVDDDVLLYEIARRALGGPGDPGRASYQVAVTRCDACKAVSLDAGGESHAVDDEIAEMIACDSQDIGNVDGHADAADGDCPLLGESAPLENNHNPHVGDHGSPLPPAEPAPRPKPSRATQTIPPALSHYSPPAK
jgi:hypothetical protein